jgi:hypothetical protein
MNVLADYHHGDLYYSLHLLFEERLGMKLYRPIGWDWFYKGFWKIAEPYNNAPDTIEQFLGVPSPSKPSHEHEVHRYGEVTVEDGVYHIPCLLPDGYYIQKAITFDKFLKMDFKYIIATYHGHDEAYYMLCKKYKPEAVYIMQIGNIHVVPRYAKNVMMAVDEPMPPNVNYIKYFPEHHRAYCYEPPKNHNVIKSFINCLEQGQIQRTLWYRYERALPEFVFKMHGILGRDGVIGNNMMPQAIKDSAFVWHVKETGCGGFVPRQALSCGRPVIIKSSFIRQHNTLEGILYEDSVNCIDLDAGTMVENINKIKYFSDPDRHNEMCKRTAEKFRKDVDFDKEAEKIRGWLETLKPIGQKSSSTVP